MMKFEFEGPTDATPTRVSVGGREYEVIDSCIEAPAEFEADLAMHGFRMRHLARVLPKQRG